MRTVAGIQVRNTAAGSPTPPQCSAAGARFDATPDMAFGHGIVVARISGMVPSRGSTKTGNALGWAVTLTQGRDWPLIDATFRTAASIKPGRRSRL